MAVFFFSLLLLSLLSMTGATEQKASFVAGRYPQHTYGEALWKSLMFFEGQRSGKLPSTQRVTWRKDSALQDGHDIGVDLVGGYYDAGDNLKFHFPMAFTTTVLSWSIIEFGVDMGPEIRDALAAVRWATDYMLKATSIPNKVYAGVGDPSADHNCWERPEDMDTTRTVYAVDAQNPGSEVSAEIAAALAAASIAFRESDHLYSDTLLKRSLTVFEFANTYRGSYNTSLGRGVCPFYCDWSGYLDELLWGAAWIYKASSSSWHWEYVANNLNWIDSYGSASVGEFGWDDKHAGIYVLLHKSFTRSKNQTVAAYQNKAQDFACRVLPESPTKSVTYTAGGLLYKNGGLQNAAALSFLLVVFAQYLTENNNQLVRCGNKVTAPPSRLIELAKKQVDYILGDNPMHMSYMVGYGNKFPRRIHHRASSLPSIDSHPAKIQCKDGTPYYQTSAFNPNLLVGAVVAGPSNGTDYYHDLRPLNEESEPATYGNAPLVGVLAYFNAHG